MCCEMGGRPRPRGVAAAPRGYSVVGRGDKPAPNLRREVD